INPISTRRPFLVLTGLILTLVFTLASPSWHKAQGAPQSAHEHFLSAIEIADSTPFLYLPFSSDQNYLQQMTSLFDHSSPNYDRSDGKMISFSGHTLQDECISYDFNNNVIPSCKGPIQTFKDNLWEIGHQYYNGHDGYDWAVTGDVLAAAAGTIDFVG